MRLLQSHSPRSNIFSLPTFVSIANGITDVPTRNLSTASGLFTAGKTDPSFPKQSRFRAFRKSQIPWYTVTWASAGS